MQELMIDQFVLLQVVLCMVKVRCVPDVWKEAQLVDCLCVSNGKQHCKNQKLVKLIKTMRLSKRVKKIES
jgi:hypothetical protein